MLGRYRRVTRACPSCGAISQRPCSGVPRRAAKQASESNRARSNSQQGSSVYGTAQRRAFYAQACGDGEYPNCNLCGLPARPGQKWDESHEGAPHALGGATTGIAHRRCNRRHGSEVVTPMVADAKRQYDKHRGIHVSRSPMPGGREVPRKRTMDERTRRHVMMNASARYRRSMAFHHVRVIAT